MGIRVQVENFGSEKSLRYQLVESKYEYAKHMHQFAELFIVLEGEVNVTVDERRELISENQAAFILSYQPHEYNSKARSKVAILVFSSTLISEFFKSSNGMVGEKTVFNLKASTIHALKERIIEKDAFDIYDIKGTLYLAIQDYLSQIKLKPTEKKGNMPSGIVRYICEHISVEITLDSVAAKLGYSPKYLSNCIKKIFDMNFSTLVANARVDKARHLLRETNKSRAEICYECGFGSERSFHRQFKQIMNYTPNEYREKLGNRINNGELRNF